jgi:hypothetical protein
MLYYCARRPKWPMHLVIYDNIPIGLNLKSIRSRLYISVVFIGSDKICSLFCGLYPEFKRSDLCGNVIVQKLDSTNAGTKGTDSRCQHIFHNIKYFHFPYTF